MNQKKAAAGARGSRDALELALEDWLLEELLLDLLEELLIELLRLLEDELLELLELLLEELL